MSTHRQISSRRIEGGWIPLVVAACLLGSTASWSWIAAGTVKNAKGDALADVAVSVKDSSYMSATDPKGTFRVGSSAAVGDADRVAKFAVRSEGGTLRIECPGEGALELALLDPSGVRLWGASARRVDGVARVALPADLRFGTAFLKVRADAEVFYQPVANAGTQGWKVASHLVASRSMAAYPVLRFSKSGYRDTTYAMKGSSDSGFTVTMADTGKIVPDTSDFVEDHKASCVLPALPAASALTSNSKLPSPFKMADGTAVTTKAQWKCKVEETRAQLEKYVMGDKMRDATVKATMSGTTMSIAISAGGKSVTLKVTVTKPSGAGPFPAIIGYGGGNIGGYSGLPVATISYSPFDVASEGSGRGKGLYYDLYGSNATAGELMAWAWGVSRIIDAVAANPSFGIDAKRIAVTGCSRYGKGALIAGVMDQRIKLTIPQESGSGGVAAWRLIPNTSGSQPIASTASEQYWLRSDFPNTFNSAPGKLPFDNHETIAMVIPNGMLILDNSIDWLGPKNGYGSAVAGLEIFKAMGVPEALTYTSVGGHTHCSQPGTQDHWVKSYVQKYLLGGAGEAAKIEAPSDYTFDKAKWIDWTTPTLQ